MRCDVSHASLHMPQHVLASPFGSATSQIARFQASVPEVPQHVYKRHSHGCDIRMRDTRCHALFHTLRCACHNMSLLSCSEARLRSMASLSPGSPSACSKAPRLGPRDFAERDRRCRADFHTLRCTCLNMSWRSPFGATLQLARFQASVPEVPQHVQKRHDPGPRHFAERDRGCRADFHTPRYTRRDVLGAISQLDAISSLSPGSPSTCSWLPGARFKTRCAWVQCSCAGRKKRHLGFCREVHQHVHDIETAGTLALGHVRPDRKFSTKPEKLKNLRLFCVFMDFFFFGGGEEGSG